MRVSITKAIQMLLTRLCSTGEELAAPHSSVVAYSVLHNVLNGKFALDPVAEILHQETNGIQRVISTLPIHLQTAFRKSGRFRVGSADTADPARLERPETQLAELRADPGRRHGAQLASPTDPADHDERALHDYAAYQRRLAARK